MALTVMYGMKLDIKTERIMEISQLVQDITGIKVQSYKPLVGTSVFVETPDTHIESILRARLGGGDAKKVKEKKAKSFIAPEFIGQKTSLLFGPSALGGESVTLKAQEMGISVNHSQVSEIITIMRDKVSAVGSLSESEVEDIILSIAR